MNIPTTSRRIRGSRRAAPSAGKACAATLLALVLLLLPAAAAGQALRARLLHGESDTPLAGAFLTLRAADGEGRVSRLSDAYGWALLPAPRAGQYRLRVEQLGYETVEVDVAIGDSTEVRTFHLAVRPIALPAITAATDRRCQGAVSPAAEAAVIWEEVRKALEVARWTETETSLRYVIRQSVQRLDPRSLEVESEQVTHAELERSGSPFVSKGARDLSERGFIRTAGDGYEYYGPDAEVILSPSFLERHCFAAVSDPAQPELVGLRFAPAANAPPFDIEGVLWVDRASAELRYLAYHYSRLPVNARREQAAGKIEFQHLDTGHWIVRAWWIQAPRTRSSGRGTAPQVVGVERIGREVLSVTDRSVHQAGGGGS